MGEKYRYPGGGYAFSEVDEPIFFGRKTAIDYIYNSVLLNQSVVIYGKSGIGKSSLLQAGVIPRLQRAGTQHKDRKNFRICKIRTGIWQREQGTSLIERVRDLPLPGQGSNAENDPFLPFLPEEIKKTLWYKFKSLQFLTRSAEKGESYILVIDQLEEFFTYPSVQLLDMLEEFADLCSPILPDGVRLAVEEGLEGNAQRLSPEMSAVLYQPIPVKFIFSIRSDKLYLVGRLKKAVPTIMQNMFELHPFTKDQAAEAIIDPSKMTGEFLSCPFDLSEVKEPVIAFLLKQSDGELEYNTYGASIEPFALQIVCRYIERKIVIADKVEKVTAKMLVDKLESIFQNFYTEIIKELFLDPVMEQKVRELIEEKMIYEKDGSRIPIAMNVIEECGIDSLTLDKVIGSKIIHETTTASRVYEISHDSLVAPILKAKTDRKEEAEKLHKKYDSPARDIKKEINIRFLNQEILKNPYDYRLFKNKAEHLYAEGAFEEAARNYQKALEFYKGFDEELNIGLSNCYFNLGNYEASNAELFKVLERKSTHEFAFYYIGYNYFMLKDFEKAIEYYTRLLSINPVHKEVNYNLAIIHKELKQYNAAEYFFKRILEIYPDEYTAYIALIEILVLLKDEGQADEYVRRAIDLNIDDAETYAAIGNIYHTYKNYEPAIRYYQQALLLRPNSGSFHAKLGVIYSYVKDIEGSIHQFRLACKYDPKNSFYHTWLGFLYQHKNNVRSAIKEFKNSIKFDPNYRYPVAALAACYRRIGKPEEYRRYVNRAQKLSPTDADDLYSIASFEALCGNNDKALENLKKALEKKLRNPDFAESDPDFDFLKEDPRFFAIINEAKQASGLAS